MKDERLDIIDQRYSNRLETKKAGWADEESYARKVKSFNRLVADYAIPRGARILELGCGSGNTVLHIDATGFDAWGIDISSKAIEWAKDNARQQKSQAHFIVGSVTDLQPFRDDFFDMVFDGDCLWMVLGADRHACFSSVFRKLKPKGLFYALAHIVKDEYDMRNDIDSEVHFDPVRLTSSIRGVPMYQFSTESIFRKEIENAGFEILRCAPLENGPIDDKSKNEMPFVSGSISVEARKPIQKKAKRNKGLIPFRIL